MHIIWNAPSESDNWDRWNKILIYDKHNSSHVVTKVTSKNPAISVKAT